MASEQPSGALGKVSTVFATKLKSFTFLPVRKKLPTEGKVITTRENDSSRDTTLGDPVGSERSMAEEHGVYKAKIVFVRDSEDVEPKMMSKHSQTQLKPTDKSALSLSPAPAMDHAEIGCIGPKPSPVTTETSHNKHPGISQLGCHNSEVNSGLFLNSMSQREEGVLSPASSVDLFTSPTSSKESLLSEGWEQPSSWSTLQMLSPTSSPVPFSSPCSPVRSGTFTPSVLRLKRHALASGSSLAQMPNSSSRTLCSDSQAPLPRPPSACARHRPPPTQLSLLTAILRKGRLPVLSTALHRPYTPCWPITPASMSSCVACSAASTVTPMEGSLAKPCDFSNMGCNESTHSAKPKFISDTVSMPPKIHNNVGISTKPVEALDSTESNTFDSPAITSRVISSAQCASSLNVPSSSPYQPREVHKDTCVPMDASSFIFSSFCKARSLSPKSSHLSHFSSENQVPTPVSCDHSVLLHSDHSKEPQDSFSSDPGRGPTSIGSTLITNYTKPSHAPSSTFKHEQMPHDASPTPGLKHNQTSQDTPASTVLKHTNNSSRSHSPNFKKVSTEIEQVCLVSPAFGLSPSHRAPGLTHLAYTPPVSPVCPLPRPSSRSPTSDHCTLSPSPAVPSHQFSPSPSYSFCSSSPSPSLRASTPDCTDRDSKSRKPYKIKSTYKALAAIPTNTLLLEQQAIDDEVEMNEASLEPSDSFAWEDPHSQMCTPAQLRQQSAELYAVIDEVLEHTNQTCQSGPANKLTVISSASETPRKLTSPSPRSLGRETKYASFPCQSPGPTERIMRHIIFLSGSLY
ncbi:hypothetical protein P4O66_013417 [Electrophorus voltai]|uniref:Muscular LMNA-interacting protein n=1 Tax=Electrophorus voltai TaxID=2609070 RepID=A0AAD8Z1Q8_9TELE|nr:hypothetical protein P4O66_013417 [Electrophorus voltai]